MDHARKKRAGKRGKGVHRSALIPTGRPRDLDDLIAVDKALTRFATTDAAAARLAALRPFAGLSVEEAGDALGVSRWINRDTWIAGLAGQEIGMLLFGDGR
jgi:hypothetical protein